MTMHSTTTLRWVAAALALGATIPVDSQAKPRQEPGATEPSKKDEARTCEGEFSYSGGESQRAARDAAIDKLVDDMSMLVRGIARSRLKKATAIPKNINIVRQGDELATIVDGKRFAAKLNGTPVEAEGPNGDKLQLSHRLRGNRIEQTFKGDEGGRRNTYRCTGERMYMDVTVFSPKLPHELHYRLSFKKKQ
jgi:hypothetical protein